MRIVRLANFVMPRSGGLRTALYSLGEGYPAAGVEPVLVVPGEPTSPDPTRGAQLRWTAPAIPGGCWTDRRT